MNILLAYGYSQEAVPAYLEAELRRHHRVLTCGPSRGRPQDLPCESDAHVDEILAQLPADFQPELFMWVESPTPFLPRGVEGLPCPTVFYETAALWNHFWAARYARGFDFVFLNSQRLDIYERAGNPRVYPLKNACEAAMIAEATSERPIDVAFLGTVHAVLYPERARYLVRLQALAKEHGLNLFIANGLYRENLREVYRSSKIIFNSGFMGEGLNMRIFEAMVCGALSFTNNGDMPGVSSYFQHGEHLVIYDEARFEEQVLYYLRHDEERRAIAQRGQDKVLRDHAYDRPVAEIMAVVQAHADKIPSRSAPAPAERELDQACGYYFLLEYAAAARALDRAEARAPAHLELALARAVLGAAAGTEDAEGRFRAAMASEHPMLRTCFAHWLLSQDRPAEAAALVEDLPSFGPDWEGMPWPRTYYPHTLDLARLDWLQLGMGDRQYAARERFIHHQRLEILAEAARRTGETVRQRRYLEGLAASRPHDPVVWHLRGDLAQREGGREEAGHYYRRALEENPLSLATRANMITASVGSDPDEATLRQACRELEQALELADLAVRLLAYPKDHEAVLHLYNRLGELRAMLGEVEAAHEAWGQSLERKHDQPMVSKWFKGEVRPPRLRPRAEAKVTGRLTSIILLTFNQLPYTVRCIESLFRHTHEPFELIVVDNASTDGTVGYLQGLQAARDQVKVLFNSANRGFSGGCNQAIAAAAGDLILLLNNDTVVPRGWLEDLILALDQPGVGMVGPRSNCITGPQLVEGVSYDPFTLEGFDEFTHQWRSVHAGQTWETHRIIGFCMLMKREVLDRIGGLDTGYGIGNFEDDDFCLRVRLAGYQIRVADEVLIHHFGSVTFTGQKIDYRASMETNWIKFKQKWRLPSSLPLEGGYRFAQALEHPFDPAIHTHPLYVREGSRAELPDRKGFNFVLAEPDDARLRQVVRSYLEAFAPGDDVALHLLAGSRAGEIQELLLALIAELGRSPEEIPDLSLLDQPKVAMELPAFLRAADAVLGAAEPLRGARDMGLPALELPDSALLRSAVRDFPELAWQEQAPRLQDYARDFWLVPGQGDWEEALPRFLADPDAGRGVSLLIRVAPDALERTHQAIQAWLTARDHDPRRIPDVMLLDLPLRSEVAVFRLATAWFPSVDPRERAIAAALGLPGVPTRS